MKSLSKADLERRNEIIKRYDAAKTAAEAAHANVDLAIAAMNEKIAAMNEIVSEAQGFVEDMASEIDAYMSERSEAWCDSDKGQAYTEWKQAYEYFPVDQLDEFYLPDFDPPDLEAELGELPEEPSL